MTVTMVSIPSINHRRSSDNIIRSNTPAWKMKEDSLDESIDPSDLEESIDPSDLEEVEFGMIQDLLNLPEDGSFLDSLLNTGGQSYSGSILDGAVGGILDDMEGILDEDAFDVDRINSRLESGLPAGLFSDQDVVGTDDNSSMFETLPDIHCFALGDGQQNQTVPKENVRSTVCSDHPYSVSMETGTSQPPSGSLSRCSSTSESLDSIEDSAVNVLAVARDQARSLLQQQASGAQTSTSADTSPSIMGRRRSRQRATPSASSMSRLKKWNALNSQEQMESITELTHIISTQLGVRERLEAIKIINPNSPVSPTDGKFVLDTNSINNARFTRLQKFVRLHADDYGRKGSSSQSTSRKSQMISLPPNVAEEEADSAQSKTGKKRKSRGGRRKGSQLIFLDPAAPKTVEQRVKEAQSGYFVHEVRMSVSCSNPSDDDEEDLNILD